MLVTREDVLKKVAEVAVERLDVKFEDVKPESSFIDDLGADSLDLVELIQELEEEFEINVPDDRGEGVKTVGDAASIIMELMKKD